MALPEAVRRVNRVRSFKTAARFELHYLDRMMLFSCGNRSLTVAARIGAIGMSDGLHKGLKSGGQRTGLLIAKSL